MKEIKLKKYSVLQKRPNQKTQKNEGIPPMIFDFFSVMWDNT